MDDVRFFLLGDKVASRVFGQAGVYLGQDLGVLALRVKLLQLRSQAGVCVECYLHLGFQGFRLGAACVFPFPLLSGEMPRAVRRAGRAGAPSTPGGIGYLVAERLMDLNSVCSSSFLGFVLRRAFRFYRSPVICEQMQA